MKHVLTAVFFLGMTPLLVLGASKEIVQLQRDVALLQDQMRTLQRALDERTVELKTLTEQILDRTNQLNTSLAVLERHLNDRFAAQEKTLVAPVAGVGAKVDQMGNEFQFVRESVADLTSRMGKLEQRIVDLNNTVQTMNAPPAPPAGELANATPPPGLSAKTLYDNAYRDKIAGNHDLSMAQFQDYLRYFGTTELAPNAQFYIGELHYNKGEYDRAMAAFDSVLEKYPENPKTPDAFYMKGNTLVKMGERTRGAQEYYELLRRYPRSDVAAKAKTQLRNLGMSTTPPKPRKS